ncbi:MAG: ESPR-type extended signal peptide-containing protein, partial [Negativicoccus succinicivorans]|nr:ESPR-type extended signal peptide-containing protein [Negativicoccus succinicivorans]
MNQIYKIIWSKAAEAYVVTSELAKSHTKSPSGKGLRRSVTAALLVAMVAAPVAFGVYAADDTHYVSVNSDNQTADSNYNNQGAQAENSIAIGPSVKTTGEDNIVIGSGELGGKKGVTSVNGQRVLVVGHGNYFQPVSDRNGQPVAYRDSAIIGHQNKLLQGDKDDAGGGTPAYQIVHGWKNTLKGSFTGAIGYENEIKNSSRKGFGSQSMAFTIGTENTIDATGYYMGDKNRVNTLPDYKEPGSNPNIVGADLYVIGRHNIIGSSKGGEWYVDNGRIFGSDNVIYSDGTNVFGENNKVYSGSGIAIGNANKVGIDNAGNLVKNKDGRAIYNPVAVGHGNIVTGNYGVALGVTAESRGEKATAVGSTAQALSDYSAALGTESRAKGYGSVAVGSLNNTYDFDNPGYKWKKFDSGDSSSAMGVMNISTGDYSSAVGVQNKALGEKASSFGYSNTATGKESSAMGSSNTASGKSSIAVGTENNASAEQSSALEYKNMASALSSSALGEENTVSGWGSSGVGYKNTASGNMASALGYANQATEKYSFAAGALNQASGQYSSAVGGWNQAEGKRSQAVGYRNFVSGYGAVA